MAGHEKPDAEYASSPCMAHEIDPAYFDPLGVVPQQARDVARWRKAERARLLEERRALGVEGLRAMSEALVRQTRAALEARISGSQGGIVSVYWPIKSEPDLRPLMKFLVDLGLRVALPLVETKQAPLTFREWTPATKMVRGDWNIPVPPPEVPICRPDLSLVPLVGWDGAGYRLGYGGGYFDRTLAAIAPRPFTIGVGFQAARLATIFPQPHDIPMDAIVTEAGPQEIRRD
jgi:5,10-methenyltetrahydrofolate synthetase